TEWQDFPRARSTALQVRNALLKLGDNRVCRAIGHENPALLRAYQRLWALIGSLFVLFPIMSQSDSAKSRRRLRRWNVRATGPCWPIAVNSESDRSETVSRAALLEERRIVRRRQRLRRSNRRRRRRRESAALSSPEPTASPAAAPAPRSDRFRFPVRGHLRATA